jgi:hypothetical protein
MILIIRLNYRQGEIKMSLRNKQREDEKGQPKEKTPSGFFDFSGRAHPFIRDPSKIGILRSIIAATSLMPGAPVADNPPLDQRPHLKHATL